MNAFDARQHPVGLGHSIGQGGEATVYRVEGRPDVLAKIFEPAPRPNYEAKLAWMIEHPPDNPTQASNHASLAWPAELLYGSDRNLIGYMMPYIRHAVPALVVFNPRRRSKVLPTFDRRYLYRAARNLATSVAALHLSGYVVGDLNESNALVNTSAMVTLIDTDSFQVQAHTRGRLTMHYCPVGKFEYTPPELQGKPLHELTRLPEHDNFALAVLIFQLLMDGSHPFRAQWLGSGDPPALEMRIRQGLFPYTPSPSGPVRPPKNIASLEYLFPELASLFRTCFIEGHSRPSSRPSAQDWRKTLREAEKALRQCSRGHYFSVHLGSCPTCHARPQPVTEMPSGARQPARARQAKSDRRQPSSRQAAASRPAPAAKGSSPPRGPQPGSGRPVAWPPNSQPASSRATAWPPRSRPSPSASRPRVSNSPKSSSSSSWGYPRPRPNLLPTAFRLLRHFLHPLPYSPSYPSSPSQAGASTGQAATASSGSSSAPFSRTFPAPWPKPPFTQPGWLQTWLGPRVQKSLLVGGSLGALAGALPGALVGLSGWSPGFIALWTLLWALGGAAAGVWRGWRPGYQVGQLINRTLGWERFWVIIGTINGAVLGTFLGAFLAWLIFPVILGFIGGARLGAEFGRKIYLLGSAYGWERIMAFTGSTTTAVIGGGLAGFVAASLVGSYAQDSVLTLVDWLLTPGSNLLYIGSLVGALGGALGGATAGFFSDLLARLSGLVD